MIKKINIITTRSDFEKINKNGCIICKDNTFKYLGVKDMYVCDKCKSSYAIGAKGIRTMLLEDENEIRIYEKNKLLIDDSKIDVVVHTKVIQNNRPKIRVRASNR